MQTFSQPRTAGTSRSRTGSGSNILNRSLMELVKPADPSIVSVLRAVDGVAKTLGHDYCLVGATARDLLLVNALGLRPGRQTRDLDFGLALETWEQFSAFKEAL